MSSVKKLTKNTVDVAVLQEAVSKYFNFLNGSVESLKGDFSLSTMVSESIGWKKWEWDLGTTDAFAETLIQMTISKYITSKMAPSYLSIKVEGGWAETMDFGIHLEVRL